MLHVGLAGQGLVMLLGQVRTAGCPPFGTQRSHGSHESHESHLGKHMQYFFVSEFLLAQSWWTCDSTQPVDSKETTRRPVSFYHGAPKKGSEESEVVQYLEATLKDPIQGATSWGFRI